MIEDEKIGQLLREDAPPERDAAFRFGVLQRRERRRFQLRQTVILVAAPLVALIVWIGFTFAGPWLTFAALALCVAVGGACLISVPGVLQILRRLQSARAMRKN